MKKFLIFIAIAGLMSCNMKSGSGNIIEQDRNLSNFTSIKVAGDFEVKVKQGNAYSVRIEADDNLIDDIRTVVKNDELVISYKSNTNLRNSQMTVYVTAPALNSLRSSASAEIIAEGTIRSDNSLKLSASSGSTITATVDAPVIEASVSSGSEMDLKGRTRDLDLEASSGASANAYELNSENTVASVSSGASLDVFASVKLDASASSGGTINYKGAATVVKKQSSGGSVSKVN